MILFCKLIISSNFLNKVARFQEIKFKMPPGSENLHLLLAPSLRNHFGKKKSFTFILFPPTFWSSQSEISVQSLPVEKFLKSLESKWNKNLLTNYWPNFFSRFMVRKSFPDILFLLLKQTNVKVISINPLNYKKNIWDC